MATTQPSVVAGDFILTGTWSFAGVSLPPAALRDANWSAAAADRLAAAKSVHHFPVKHVQADGADVVSKTEQVHRAMGAGNVVGCYVALTTAPTGGDKKFTVDLQKSTGGGAFATILSAILTLDSSKANLNSYAATIASAAYAAGDLLRIVVTASGSTGSQGQGMVAEAFVEENPA